MCVVTVWEGREKILMEDQAKKRAQVGGTLATRGKPAAMEGRERILTQKETKERAAAEPVAMEGRKTILTEEEWTMEATTTTTTTKEEETAVMELKVTEKTPATPARNSLGLSRLRLHLWHLRRQGDGFLQLLGRQITAASRTRVPRPVIRASGGRASLSWRTTQKGMHL